MPEHRSRSSSYVPLWGIILLFLGVVFLLQTLNIIPWGLWGTMWRFWPIIVIIAGLVILLRNANTMLMSLLILVLLFGLLGIAIWQYGPATGGKNIKSYSEPLSNLEKAQVEIDIAAGNLNLGSLPDTSVNLIEAVSKSGGDAGDMRVDFQRQDSTGRLRLSAERVNRQLTGETNWEIKLSRKIPLSVDINSAVGNLELDFSDLKVTELKMDIDAGNYAVEMPTSAGTSRAEIKANVANLKISIPSGVALKLKADVKLSALDIDQSRFLKIGNYYVSRDFDTAKNRIELDLSCNLGRVEIK